jgi:hypothetical protein
MLNLNPFRIRHITNYHYHLQKMTNIDWLVLILTLGGIVGFGFWKGRVSKQNIEGYLLADRQMPSRFCLPQDRHTPMGCGLFSSILGFLWR